MTEEDRQLKNRFAELAAWAAQRGIWTYSAFLTPGEQALLRETRLDVPFILEGGVPGAERRLAAFGDEESFGYGPAAPIVCLHIRPRAPKFAEALSHRDFLGALMSLGLGRETMGDLYVRENQAWLFCLDTVAGYIREQLAEVRRTAVEVLETAAPPPEALPTPEMRTVTAASERLDAVIAGVYHLSRSESQALLRQGKVFLDGRETEDGTRAVPPGTIVSVRGLGRFRYGGPCRETRRGRLCLQVEVY